MTTADTFSKLLSALPDNLPPCSAPHPHPLPSYWTSPAHYVSPLARENSSGPLVASADIVIIGSGITGTSAAARLVEGLSKTGGGGKRRIVVVEAREFCSGATGRHGGHLTPLPVLGFASALEEASLEDVKREVLLEDRSASWVVETCKEEGWTKEVDLLYNGTVHLLKDEAADAHARSEIAAAKAAGVDTQKVKFLDSAECLKKFGAKTYSATLSPGGNFYALKLCTKLFQRAQKQASQHSSDLFLYTNTVVDTITRGEEGWNVKTTRGSIAAPIILHATNGYASHLLPFLATGPSRIVPCRGQVLSFLPTQQSNPGWTTSFSSTSGIEYFFQRPTENEAEAQTGGPIILGGARMFAGPSSNYEFGTTDDSQINPLVSKELGRYLGDQFAGFEGMEGKGEKEMEWTGIMGYRKNGCPLVGPVLEDGEVVKGQFICAGYTGHGVTRAPACAEAVAAMILAGLDGKEYRIPDWLPHNYLTVAPPTDSSAIAKTVDAKRPWCSVQ